MSEPIEVFVSRPTRVDDPYESAYGRFHRSMKASGLAPQRLGQNSYSRKAPLRAIIDLMARCHGAIVLGYPQVRLVHEVRRSAAVESRHELVLPTPWNQIEAALAFQLALPVLVLAQRGVKGGVFDYGLTGEMVFDVDLASDGWWKAESFQQPFREWRADVRRHAFPTPIRRVGKPSARRRHP